MTAAPLLVLISGHPASGKSTLAAHLAGRLQLPVLAKDDIQEALFDAGLEATDGSSEIANRVLVRVAARMLADGHDCIIDSNLDPLRWHDEVAAMLARSRARLLQIRCHAEGALLVRRFTARAGRRHPGHRDQRQLQRLRQRLLGPALAPLDLPGRVIEHDSGAGDANALDRIAGIVADALRAGAGAPP